MSSSIGGAEGAAAALVARYAATLGSGEWLSAFAARHGYDLAATPMPAASLVAPQDAGQIPLEQWPAVLVNTLRTAATRLVDRDDDGTKRYLVTYATRSMLLVRGDDEDSTDLLRKRWTLAAREALLSDVTGIEALPATLSEDYTTPLTPDGASDVMGMATVDVQVRFHEQVAGPAPYGMVAQPPEVAVGQLPTSVTVAE